MPRAKNQRPSATWRENGSSTLKLAQRVALDLAECIVTSGWPVGTVLGSEAELLEEYDVSRAVLREAVRLLEYQHVAMMRRGPGGGLVVTAPDPSAVVRSMALLLDYQSVSTPQLFEARVALELTATQLAAERLDEHGVEVLRSVLESEEQASDVIDAHIHDLHVAVAQLTGNPAISLFVEILTRLTHTDSHRSIVVDPERKRRAGAEEVAEVHRAHVAIVEAIIANDPALARHRMLRHLEATAATISNPDQPTPAKGPSSAGRTRNRV